MCFRARFISASAVLQQSARTENCISIPKTFLRMAKEYIPSTRLIIRVRGQTIPQALFVRLKRSDILFARRRGEDYELDLCLRNNLTTDEHPLGLYHPHAQWRHIKKENIGLIEVMGLAVLPSRLQSELDLLESFIAEGRNLSEDGTIAKHAAWAASFAGKLKGQPRETIRETLEQEVGKVFLHVLEDAGVFKRDDAGKAAFLRFISSLSE